MTGFRPLWMTLRTAHSGHEEYAFRKFSQTPKRSLVASRSMVLTEDGENTHFVISLAGFFRGSSHLRPPLNSRGSLWTSALPFRALKESQSGKPHGHQKPTPKSGSVPSFRNTSGFKPPEPGEALPASVARTRYKRKARTLSGHFKII